MNVLRHRSGVSLPLSVVFLIALGPLVSALRAQPIDLGDITAGGDGSGTAPAGSVGVDPRNGSFITQTDYFGGHLLESDVDALGGSIGDGVNPSPVAASDFIDSVFFLADDLALPFEDPYLLAITQSGVEAEFSMFDHNNGRMFNHILRDTPGGVTPPDVDGDTLPDSGQPFSVGGAQFTRGVGIHAAGGITYDLDEIRAHHGEGNVGCFTTFWGMDGCGSGDVNLFAILSSDADGVISTQSGTFIANEGELLQIEIPANARYLTLVTGTNGALAFDPAADACDHGTFAAATITGGPCSEPETTRIDLTPDVVDLPAETQLQLTVQGLSDFGPVEDLTAAATGTIYSVNPAGVVDVDADGLLTALAEGTADVTATNGTFTDTSTVNVTPALDFIDLGGVTAGGDGKSPPPAGNIGINADTGQFGAARIAAGVNVVDGINPQPVNGLDGASDSEFIDSVFVLDLGIGQVINSEGVAFDFDPADVQQGWELILNGREPGGPDDLQLGAAGTFTRGIGCHSAQGITFDLEALRSRHGEDAVQYVSAIAGEASGQAGGSPINAYIILSNDAEVLDFAVARGQVDGGQFLQLEIPDDALFVTFAVGAFDGGNGGAHGAFALAQIVPDAADTSDLSALIVSPGNLALRPDEEVTLQLEGVLASGDLAGVAAPIDPADATFESDNPSVAVVDANGTVRGVDVGTAAITVTASGITETVGVLVDDPIDLGNITAGGDGRNPPPVGNIGINADTGQFGQARIAVGVQVLDGVNPQPVDGTHPLEPDFPPADDSPFIDSVFVLDLGPGQVINSEGIAFDFDIADVQEGWELILDGREPGGPDDLQMGTAGTFTRGIGCHSAQGITFNLEEIRAEHGAENVRYVSAIAGEASGTAGGSPINAYIILSNDAEILDFAVARGQVDGGEFLQLEIPEEALFTTFAVGAFDGGNGGAHGAFALAQVSATEVDTTSVSEFSVTPQALILGIDETALLSASGVLDVPGLAGVPVAIDPEDIDFSSDNSAVAAVDDQGQVTALGNGLATITASFAGFSATVSVRVGDSLDLGDLVGGGDGTGTADPLLIGIDPRNGQFTDLGIEAHIMESDLDVDGITPIGDGLNPSPVEESDFIDSVFFLALDTELPIDDPYALEITQSGVTAEFPLGDHNNGRIWNHILADSSGGVTPTGLPYPTAGQMVEEGIGIHASGGITFDLREIRAVHGDDAVGTFTTLWGMDDCAGDVNLYAILSSDAAGVIETRTGNFTGSTGEVLELEIPASADYLTLATGTNGGADPAADGCDHGSFAEARLFAGGGGPGPGPRFRRGDTDGNGRLEITDPINSLSFQFLGTFTPPCKDAADFDDNGRIEITDPIASLSHQFLGQAPPAPPGKENCGVDPTPDDGDGDNIPGEPDDDLGCETYPAAGSGPDAACN